MGFFKNLGNSVKKGLKQVSLKNLVKVGTPLLGSIPLFGGVAQQVIGNASEAHEMKKQATKLAAEGKQAEAAAMQEQADFLSQQSGALVGQQVGTQLNAFTKGAVNEAKAQMSAGNNVIIGQAGATVVDLTISEWFKKHWLKLVVGVGAIGGVLYYFKNRNPKSRYASKSTRRKY